MNRESLKALIRRHEGLRLLAYRCPADRWTIGYGHTGTDVFEGLRVTTEEAEDYLDKDTALAVGQCREIFPWFNGLCDMRQNVVASMVFNIGAKGFLRFKKMIKAVGENKFVDAANEMLLSRWAAQVGSRATELADMMRTGDTIH